MKPHLLNKLGSCGRSPDRATAGLPRFIETIHEAAPKRPRDGGSEPAHETEVLLNFYRKTCCPGGIPAPARSAVRRLYFPVTRIASPGKSQSLVAR